MLTFSGNHYSVVLGLVIQYLSGEDTFPGRLCSRVIILNSNAGGQLGRASARPSCPPRCPQVSCEHTILLEDTTLTPRIYYFISYTKVGLFISFSGCLGLLAGVCRFWQVFDGFDGPLLVPTC